MTGTDIINEALLLLKRITPGQTCSNDELATSQLALNYLIDKFNADGNYIYSSAPITFSLTGAASYTIGTGATINVNRPVKVEAWAVRTSSGQSNGGKPVSAEEFATLALDRSATGARCKILNYDAAFPMASVHLYPIPVSGGTLELWVWEQIPQITNWTATINLPPAYLQALVYNLATDLAGKFVTSRGPIDPLVIQTAQETKANLAQINADQASGPRQSTQGQRTSAPAAQPVSPLAPAA